MAGKSLPCFSTPGRWDPLAGALGSLRLPPALTDHLTSTKPGIELGDAMTRQDKVPDQGGESLEEHARASR